MILTFKIETTNDIDNELSTEEVEGIDIEEARERMKKEDKVDRKRERVRIRERHKEVKRKARQERIATTQVAYTLLLRGSKRRKFHIILLLWISFSLLW